MTYRATATAVIALFASAAMPSVGLAATGGSGLTGSGNGSDGSGSGGSGKVTPNVQPGNVTVSATGDGITLATRASAILRNGLSFSGDAPRSDAGKTLEIERLGHETGWTWTDTVTTTIERNGQFSAVWHTNHIGRFAIRSVLETTVGAASAPPTVTITVYRQSLATMYGPGFWGQRTACGKKLTRSMLGVANRTLKCGTEVALYYRGRTLTVPVIDRGPYANGADWDLTEATDTALGIPGTATIGAVSLPPAPSADTMLTQG
jgi:rare lipoprotein A